MDSKTPASQQITAWLTDWRRGDREAPEHLFAVVYPELRRIAARFLHNERNHHTLEPNALVNELCVRLLGSEPLAYQDRAHFFAMAAQSMRRILHARARIAEKRGGERERVTLTAVEGWNPVATMRTFCLDQALTKLGKAEARPISAQPASSNCDSSGGFRKPRSPRCWAFRSSR
jgi:RNA polymerase sigma factor (TIGR02999 family)